MELRDELLLDALQYGLRPSPTPYGELAGELGIEEEYLLRELRRFAAAGYVRRVGYSVNYRAYGQVSALVAARVPGERAGEAARTISEVGGVKHSYVRDHPKYNLWFTYRARSADELSRKVDRLLEAVGARDGVKLLSVRTCKLSVKYDLERGVSWSEPSLLPERVPTLEELGIDKEVVEALERLPASPRPFREISSSLGGSEEAILDLARELESKGVLHGFGAVLDPGAVGFAHNAVVMGRGGEEECEALATSAPEATHAVLRAPLDGEWERPVYYVVHGRERGYVEAAAGYAAELAGVEDLELVYGLGGFTN